MTDELVLSDLPGKLAVLVFALATLALGWELWGVIFAFGFFPRSLNSSDFIGVALFTTGWLGLLAGLLVLRHRRRDAAG
ncbi:hypothetical protein D1781_14680 [Amnibacterium setariae]|uniref:Uncharacterized protein n=1 Tax=Amnibacterium setariae TaxID=2306585 RepID=A0A3A1U2G2_9MICO|nr:hypothetical protein D1781_14680 [Amnibacterium setariae]